MPRGIIMVGILEALNKHTSSLDESIDVLKDFLIDGSTEAFLKEESAFGKTEDFIKCNSHLVDCLNKTRIEIRSNEHPPAHFHVTLAEFEGSYTIDECQLMEGNIPRSYEKKIILWYRHGGKEKLIQKWNQTRPINCAVGMIE